MPEPGSRVIYRRRSALKQGCLFLQVPIQLLPAEEDERSRNPNIALIYYVWVSKKILWEDEVNKSKFATGSRNRSLELYNIYVFPWQNNQTTFFTNNLPELMASTTSLNPITNAPNVGVRNPNAATGMATIL